MVSGTSSRGRCKRRDGPGNARSRTSTSRSSARALPSCRAPPSSSSRNPTDRYSDHGLGAVQFREMELSTMATYWRAEQKLISHNFSKTGVIRPPKGLVVHVTDGALTLQALFNFFNKREQKLRDGSSTRS